MPSTATVPRTNTAVKPATNSAAAPATRSRAPRTATRLSAGAAADPSTPTTAAR